MKWWQPELKKKPRDERGLDRPDQMWGARLGDWGRPGRGISRNVSAKILVPCH